MTIDELTKVVEKSDSGGGLLLEGEQEKMIRIVDRLVRKMRNHRVGIMEPQGRMPAMTSQSHLKQRRHTMPQYCIIETEDGWTIVEHESGTTAEETAHRTGGTVIDPGPYDSYEDACDALEALQGELQEDDASDVPGSGVTEGRYEFGD